MALPAVIPEELIPLTELLKNGPDKVLFVIGTGVSIGASNGSQEASWYGLIKSGLDYAQSQGKMPEQDVNARKILLDSAFTDPFSIRDVLNNADSVVTALGGQESDVFKQWVEGAVGSLCAKPGHGETVERIAALARCGAVVMTTNYDSILMDAVGGDGEFAPVTWRNPKQLLDVINGRAKGIIHIHGHWADPASMVFGNDSYEAIRAAVDLQTAFKALLLTKTWVYVGCGAGGLDDPNLGALLQWVRGSEFSGSSLSDYFFADSETIEKLPTEAKNSDQFVTVPYEQHDEVTAWLKSIHPAHVPSWLSEGLVSGVLQEGMPPTRESSAALRSKAQFYGGEPHLSRTALQFVALEQNFRRSAISKLAEKIGAQGDHCCTFTLKSVPGGGLTIGLAELVSILKADRQTRIFSIVGSPSLTAKFLELLKQAQCEDFSEWLRSEADHFERTIFVIDDVSSASMTHRSNLENFVSGLEQIADLPQTIFVFGSHTEDLGHDLHGEVELNLAEADCYACYQAMAASEPAIIKGYDGGLTELFRDHAPARDFGNDVQALIDFMLEYGNPIQETREHWLANLDGLTNDRKDPLRLVAVAQLLGLGIPQKLAATLFGNDELCKAHGLESFVRADPRFKISTGDWTGISLACPRRARSILIRAGLLKPERIFNDFGTLVQEGLRLVETEHLSDPAVTDFVRHIIQRLGNHKNYLVWPGDNTKNHKFFIGQALVFKYLPALQKLETLDIDSAKWAGAISPFVTLRKYIRPPEKIDILGETHVVDIFNCIELFLKRYFDDVANASKTVMPADAVPIMKATRRIIGTRPLKAKSEGIVGRVAAFFSFERIVDLVNMQLDMKADDPRRRVNELIHSYCKLMEALPASLAPRRRNRAMIRYLCFMIQKVGIEPDAGTWIASAQLIPDSRRTAINEIRWNHFVQRAQKCIDESPLTQATSQKDLDKVMERVPLFPQSDLTDA